MAADPGSIYRTIARIWRKYFHPPPADYGTTWGQERRRPGNNLTDAPRSLVTAGADPASES
jgi:hypothetical protein